MNTPRLNLIALVACMALILPFSLAGAQAGATLEGQIRAAVEAEDDSYFELREKILAQGEAARAALQAATKWDRPEERVIAQAMLKWMDEENGRNIRRGKDLIYASPPETPHNQYNKEYAERIAKGHCYNRIGERVRHALSKVGGWEGDLVGGLHLQAGEKENREYWPSDIYLLELSLKGLSPEFLEEMGMIRTPLRHELFRMCAAAAAGVSPCADTVAILITLLDDAKHPARVREGALVGLACVWVRANKAPGGGLPEDPRCLPTFDKALDDPDREVRLQAYGFLTLLTEGNLGIDLVGRTRNLSPEDVKLIREHLAKWQAEQKKKTKGDAAPVEQEGKNESTPTPPPETAPSP